MFMFKLETDSPGAGKLPLYVESIRYMDGKTVEKQVASSKSSGNYVFLAACLLSRNVDAELKAGIEAHLTGKFENYAKEKGATRYGFMEKFAIVTGNVKSKALRNKADAVLGNLPSRASSERSKESFIRRIAGGSGATIIGKDVKSKVKL